MTRFIAITALFALAMILGILTSIYGWGLTPHNWWWIIGAGIVGRLILSAMEAITKAEK